MITQYSVGALLLALCWMLVGLVCAIDGLGSLWHWRLERALVGFVLALAWFGLAHLVLQP
jgi:hypothetical protein